MAINVLKPSTNSAMLVNSERETHDRNFRCKESSLLFKASSLRFNNSSLRFKESSLQVKESNLRVIIATKVKWLGNSLDSFVVGFC